MRDFTDSIKFSVVRDNLEKIMVEYVVKFVVKS